MVSIKVIHQEKLQTIKINETKENDGNEERKSACQSDGHDSNEERQCKYDTSTEVIRESTINAYIAMGHRGNDVDILSDKQTFEVFPESVKESTPRHSVMEANVCKQHSLQQSCHK
jgi:hypothetical protein